MGTYLSTPVTDKAAESGSDADCAEVPLSWAVVDMQGWRKSMEDSHVAATGIPYPCKGEGIHAKVFAVFDGHGGAEVARFCQVYLVSVLSQQQTWNTQTSSDDPAESAEGQALVSAFHALDRMIDDDNRRDEIYDLTTTKPREQERREASSIPPSGSSDRLGRSKSFEALEQATKMQNDKDTASEETDASSPESTQNSDARQIFEFQTGNGIRDDPTKPGASSIPGSHEETPKVVDDNTDNDDDSNEAVGKDQAALMDQQMLDETEDDEPVEEEIPQATSAISSMFKKILSIGGQTGQMVVNLVDEAEQGSRSQARSPLPGPSADQPSVVRNGRMSCNLPDHPIHAGCTAIVALMTGKTLTVANAGDSRGVLCRAGGVTFPLSFDHKPQQEVEKTRINKAGGFVNHFGRVNGNLNLSRSLGDLKYKQVPGIGPAEQMITAEPDIVQLELRDDDEFIVLGCDGIWDCLSNEQAVDFVRKRLNKMTSQQICTEMLDQIISDDPRVTQGIGGDNMTVMIIDLQPSRRTSIQIAP